MHVAAVQFDIAWEDKATNHRVIEDLLVAADLPNDTFVLLPELGDTGFSFDLDRIAEGGTLPWATDLARRLGVWVQVGHARRGPDGRGRNCATIIDPRGTEVGTYEKVHPFSFGRETDHFSGGERLLVRRLADAIVCPLICYDLRFPELFRLAAVTPEQPAQVFTLGASWPEARQSHWRALLIARAIENQAYVVGVNRVGADPDLNYAGGSIIVAPSGEVVAEATDAPIVLRAELDIRALSRWREDFPALRDAYRSLLGSIPTET